MKNQNVLQEEAATCLLLILLTHGLIAFIVTSSAYTVPMFTLYKLELLYTVF